MTRIKPYLQLVRLPNLFTAAADSLAGWLIVREARWPNPGDGCRWSWPRWRSTPAGSCSTTSSTTRSTSANGRTARCPRAGSRDDSPPGSGGSRWRSGRALAALSGSTSSLVVALVLAACVLAYDAGLKRTVLGPEAMGACRGLNLLLGLSQGAAMGGPVALARGRFAGLVRRRRDLDQPVGGRDRKDPGDLSRA